MEEFIKDFPIPKGDKKPPYFILFDANIGVGKSTVAKAFAKLNGSIILNNDEVRRWLNDYSDKTGLKDLLQEYRLERLLKNNNSCVCDNNFNFYWEEKKKYYDSVGYKYYIIRLECDEETIKKRLLSRTIDQQGNNYSIATYEDYLKAKEKFPPLDDNLIDYTIDTSGSYEYAEQQVKNFLEINKLL